MGNNDGRNSHATPEREQAENDEEYGRKDRHQDQVEQNRENAPPAHPGQSAGRQGRERIDGGPGGVPAVGVAHCLALRIYCEP